MRAIMVCVNYTDLLSVTLPYNQHHFEEVHIVTDPKCLHEVLAVAEPFQHVSVWHTDLFYANGASFNKWAALEWGLDRMGRHGWLCLMDADVLWTKDAKLTFGLASGIVNVGQLCTPLRRMAPWPPIVSAQNPKLIGIPDEQTWTKYPIHRNVNEWAGYSQIFHADDPVLGPPPWHEIDWVHAGGADSLFQRKWPRERKVRPSWEVLHLGNAGENWLGRVTPFADGTVPEGAEERREAIYGPGGIWARRRAVRQAGGTEADAFRPERLGGGES